MFVSGAETKGLFNREDRGQVAWQRCKAAQERWAEEHACEDFSNYFWLAHASEQMSQHSRCGQEQEKKNCEGAKISIRHRNKTSQEDEGVSMRTN
jgi:hypothetical protein